ncbi:MAG TPA: zf-HC2 domain-containing protein [Acidimicrobiales bacterium]
MTCESWCEAISAAADGEEPGIDPRLVEAHVARCGDCRRFGEAAVRLRRHAAVAPAAPMPDLSRRIVKLDRIADRASRWGLVRALLAVVAVEIVVLSVPALLGEEASASAHEARHLGAFTLAYGAALLVVVARPARARTLLPVAATLAAALVITAVVDIVDGQVPLGGEALHVPELISVPLIWLLALPAPRRPRTGTAATDRLRATGAAGRPRLRAVPPAAAGEPRERAL